jgi:hypothetical protein
MPKRASTHSGQGEVDESPGVHAADPHLSQLVEAVDDHVEVLVAERRLHHLPVVAALLEPLALDVHDLRPPLGVTVDVAHELPNDLDRRLDPGLSAAVGHGAILPPRAPRGTRSGEDGSDGTRTRGLRRDRPAL